VAITEDDENVITAAEDLTIKIFGFRTKECYFTFTDTQECKFEKIIYNNFEDPGCSIVTTKDCRYMICESIDRSLHLFDLKQRKKIHSISNNTLVAILLVHPEIPLALSQDNQIAIFQLNTNSIGLYNIELRDVSSKIENCVDG